MLGDQARKRLENFALSDLRNPGACIGDTDTQVGSGLGLAGNGHGTFRPIELHRIRQQVKQGLTRQNMIHPYPSIGMLGAFVTQHYVLFSRNRADYRQSGSDQFG